MRLVNCCSDTKLINTVRYLIVFAILFGLPSKCTFFAISISRAQVPQPPGRRRPGHRGAGAGRQGAGAPAPRPQGVVFFRARKREKKADEFSCAETTDCPISVTTFIDESIRRHTPITSKPPRLLFPRTAERKQKEVWICSAETTDAQFCLRCSYDE